MIKKKRSKAGYWFTIQSPNGQTLATSETYTSAAMRDKGIEAVKKVVGDVLSADLRNTAKSKGAARTATVISGRDLVTAFRSPRRPSDTFHLENTKGKIVKR